MNFELVIVIVLMVLCFGAMVWEKLSVDVVALAGMGILIATGVLGTKEAFSVFSNDAAIAVASMFVLSAALIRTGALEGLTRWLDRAGGGSEVRLLLLVLPVVAMLSAFVNNTPIVVVFMPILVAQAQKHQLNQSALLMPLSYAAILGGNCTLIGTSTTILVSSTAERLGHAPIRMFEMTALALPLLILCFGFMLFVGRHLLPVRTSLGETARTAPRTFLSEVIVSEHSPWVDKPLSETPLGVGKDLRVFDVRRRGQTVAVPLSEIRLKDGDVLRIASPLEALVEIQGLPGISLNAEYRYAKTMLPTDAKSERTATDLIEALRMAECVVSPTSQLVGQTVRNLDFRRRYGVLVVALHRRGGEVMDRDFSSTPLEVGDTLLLQTDEAALERIANDSDFLLLTQHTHQRPRRSKRFIAVSLVLAVVVLATVGVLPIAALALMAAVLCVMLRCIDPHEAYRAIEWRIIMLIFGMLSIGIALEKTGGAALAAEGLLSLFQFAGPWAMLSMVLLFTSVLTEFLSNNAVAVLIAPIAINVADQLGVDARPFIIAVAIGASASFATPIGYQTNTLVYGAGGYKFSDFLRVGVPMNLIVWLLGTALIPLIWPFGEG